jgi:polyhydroxyalkanoate synthase
VHFAARQLLDMVSPSNFLPTNPEVLERTIHEGGVNLIRGFWNFVEDSQRTVAGLPPVGVDAFKVGKNIAITPGKVIARTRLMELIQYSPATKTVHPDPVLIVPAWIMKYYILDLSPNNSLVKYLVDQGFTVFMISWKNPDETYHDCGMDDYRRLGIMEALRAISQVLPERKVHALGYCLGGTLLTIAAAAMARDGDDRIKTLTLLAAQTDFSQPGELNLFVGDSTLAYLEDMMQEVGYLDGDQMAGTFQLLRSNDLIWSRMTRDYLMGERQQIFDLMAWNADATRMPARMHSEYLRKIFFNNELAQGRYLVDGRAIALRDIRAPMFVVGTETDHVAPWRSVYQINVISDTDVTFLLTSGGHNAGIISEPGRKNRAYRVATAKHDDPYIDPEIWLQQNKPVQGSWWPEWVKWLRAGSNEFAAPPPIGAPEAGYIPICDAPGTYVFE